MIKCYYMYQMYCYVPFIFYMVQYISKCILGPDALMSWYFCYTQAKILLDTVFILLLIRETLHTFSLLVFIKKSECFVIIRKTRMDFRSNLRARTEEMCDLIKLPSYSWHKYTYVVNGPFALLPALSVNEESLEPPTKKK